MPDAPFTPKTTVSIDGENFLIDGVPTHQGREFRGTSIEGLMMNSRMANAMWDDENEFTRHLWAYSENDRWRADRNTDELIDMLPTYKSKGLDCIDINLQGASPLGYYRSDEEGLADLMQRIHAVHPGATEEQIWAGVPNNESQPWISGAFTGSGDLKPAFMDRTARIIEAADALGLPYLDTMRFVIFPQALRRSLPAIGNQLVITLKMTSLVSVIGVSEILRRGNELAVTEYRPLEIYSFIALEYLVLVLVVSAGVRKLERKLGADERLGGTSGAD